MLNKNDNGTFDVIQKQLMGSVVTEEQKSTVRDYITSLRSNEDTLGLKTGEKRGLIKSNTDQTENMMVAMTELSEICYNGGMPEYGIPKLNLPVNKSRIFRKESTNQVIGHVVPKVIKKIRSRETRYEYLNSLKQTWLKNKLKSQKNQQNI